MEHFLQDGDFVGVAFGQMPMKVIKLTLSFQISATDLEVELIRYTMVSIQKTNYQTRTK